MSNRYDPPEENDAVEIIVDGEWFAWDENLQVYWHNPKTATRDDGYMLIGELPQQDDPDWDWRGDFVRFARSYLEALRKTRPKALN